MQIDWGWGAQQHYGREGQIKQSHSPYVSLSVSFTHTHINTHIYGQKDGGWIVATTCLTLSRLSATVSPTRADPSLLLPSSSRLYSEKVAVRVVPFFFFWVVWYCFFLLFPSLHHGLWIQAYLPLCRMFSGSRNVDSGPAIRLVGVGRQPGVKQVSSWY